MLLHRSPGIARILREISKIDKPHILDLGANCASMINFFSQKKCKLYFEDLPAYLGDQEKTIEEQIDRYLLDYGKTRFDVVLTWDLLNYLNLNTIQKLMAKFNEHCRPDTLFHTIRYAHSMIPRLSRRFFFSETDTVSFDMGEMQPRKAPIHSTVELLEQMHSHFVENTIMNEPGMQPGFVEHLLRYQPTQHHRKMELFTRAQTKIPIATSRAGLIHHSPGLLDVCTHLKDIKDAKILIAGSATNRSYDALAPFCSNIYVEDIVSATRWKQSQGGTLSKETLRYPSDLKFDAIILWDLFNYYRQDQIVALGERLSRHCHPSTLMYVLAHANRRIPKNPQVFYLLGSGQVKITGSGEFANNSHRLTAASLMKLLPTFCAHKSFMLQKGMGVGLCEYIFRVVGRERAQLPIRVSA